MDMKMFNYQGESIYPLTPEIKHYDWGKYGNKSVISALLIGQKSTDDDELTVDDDEDQKPYAEMWMGTHPTGPSTMKGTGESLAAFIDRNLECLGAGSVKAFGPRLPFLFKVLSIRRALSVQAHPDKELAEKLHVKFPDIYKDDNHKPELAIPMTPFKAMCGFRPLHEIQAFIKDVPELRSVIGAANADQLISSSTESDGAEALKMCFRSLMTCDPDVVSAELDVLLDTYRNRCEKPDELLDLISKLAKDFPGDVGCFTPYFLNVISAKPGEAIFLGPNVPHSYIFGDCIECMSSSDNVVRAGLTPKFKDVETLCSMLDYAGKPAEEHLLPPLEVSDELHIYKPPVADFLVEKHTVKDVPEYLVPLVPVASILLCTGGYAETSDGRPVFAGDIFFMPADRELQLLTKGKGGCILYRAMANLQHP